MDALELLALEAETIWGREAGGLSDGTVAVMCLTYDGRSAVLPGAVQPTHQTPLHITLARSWLLTGTEPVATPDGLRLITGPGALQPPTGWALAEWDDLLGGKHGPWAAVADHDQILSLAHCARLTDQAAEVGVQTEVDARGRGLARIVINAWLSQMQRSKRILFYSAFEDNQASHRVITKCGGQPLGMLSRVFVDLGPAGRRPA